MHRQKQQKTKLICTLLFLGASMSANAGLFGFGGTSWKEEVLLHDGSKIVVERWVKRGGRHEIGQAPPVKEESLKLSLPTTSEDIVWKTSYSADVGFADFMPLLLDLIEGTVYLVSTPVGCLSYNKWGRPNPPYVAFKLRSESKEWQQIALSELSPQIRTPNLIISSPDMEVERRGQGFVAADEIKQINGRLTQPEYRTILREPVKSGEGSLVHCDELVFYKGAWVGPGDSIGKRMRDLETK